MCRQNSCASSGQEKSASATADVAPVVVHKEALTASDGTIDTCTSASDASASVQVKGRWQLKIDPASSMPVLRHQGRRQLRIGFHALLGTLSLATTLGALVSTHMPLRWASVVCTMLLALSAVPMLSKVPSDAPVPGTIFLAQHKLGFRLALHVIWYSNVRVFCRLSAFSASAVALSSTMVVMSLLRVSLDMKLQDAFNWPIVFSVLADYVIQCSVVGQPVSKAAAIAAFWNREIVDDAFLHLTTFTCCIVSFLFTLSFRKVIPEKTMYLLSGCCVCVEFGTICLRALTYASMRGQLQLFSRQEKCN